MAFYSSQQPLDIEVLRDRLGESLPEYMVPSAFHWRERLPLTANSKIDKKTLTKLAGELTAVEDRYDAPNTPTEQRLAAAWAKVLGIPQEQIGRLDHFFDRGGTSLSAVKLAINSGSGGVPQGGHGASGPRGPGGRRGRQVRAGSPSCCRPCRRSNGAQTGALVCFPYAGGNAVNFQPMAQALRGSGLAVYAVELPGHDIAATGESFAPLAQVVDRVVAEITGRGLSAVLLWGHSSGTAFAVETARRLERARDHGASGCSLARSCSVPRRTGAPPSPSSADAATPRSPRG